MVKTAQNESSTVVEMHKPQEVLLQSFLTEEGSAGVAYRSKAELISFSV